jgi:hypothetical protein
VLKVGNKLDSIGQHGSKQAIVIREATNFIAECYRENVGPDDMSDIRYKQWIAKLGRKNAASVSKLKTLPHTTEEFIENVKRAHFQTCIWRSGIYWQDTCYGPIGECLGNR